MRLILYKLPELEQSVREGRLLVPSFPNGRASLDIPNRVPDGNICLNESGELAVTKFAVEPVSYAYPVLCQLLIQRLGLVPSGSRGEIRHWLVIIHFTTWSLADSSIDEGSLRRALFEHTGGSYPELITRGDIKLFLPPIGGLTVYCFGDPSKMSDESVRLALRVHDEVSFFFGAGRLSTTDFNNSATEVTCSALTFVRVVHTSFMVLKKL